MAHLYRRPPEYLLPFTSRNNIENDLIVPLRGAYVGLVVYQEVKIKSVVMKGFLISKNIMPLLLMSKGTFQN